MKRKTRKRKSDRRWKPPEIGLPADYPWKVLNKLTLDLQEYLTEMERSTLEQITRNRDLEGYYALSEVWGLQSIASTDIELDKIRAKYLLASLIKKFQFQSNKDERIERAVEIFRTAEDDCKSYNKTRYKELAVPETDWGVEILHHARGFLRKLLGAELPGHQGLLERSRHGPGSTIGTCNGDISQYHKYAGWPYSCTKDAFRYAQFAIQTDQRWHGALRYNYRKRKHMKMHAPIDEAEFWAEVVEVVDGNRITFVPKDAQKERTIAIEPTLNLYLQLGVDGYIRRRLKRWGVDLDDQTKNQVLARKGSLRDDSLSFVTIDLSAASDSVSTKLCELLLPAQWYSYLMDLRSPCGEMGNETISYDKISSMGNGYTFALESAIFTALIVAVMKAGGGRFSQNEFAVFGDDLIVRKRYYYQLVEALRLSGFKVNLDKTFFIGPVRESCGTDWLNGSPLRPVFFDNAPSSIQDLFCDYNRLKRLLELRWGIEESNVKHLYEKWIPTETKTLVGPYSDEDFDSYIHAKTPPQGAYEASMYEYSRIVQTSREKPGTDFEFRKLMHSLKGKTFLSTIDNNRWSKQASSGKGSRFTVTSRNALTLGKTSSSSDVWRNEYAEISPEVQRKKKLVASSRGSALLLGWMRSMA
jgi:hypothetical protein